MNINENVESYFKGYTIFYYTLFYLDCIKQPTTWNMLQMLVGG